MAWKWNSFPAAALWQDSDGVGIHAYSDALTLGAKKKKTLRAAPRRCWTLAATSRRMHCFAQVYARHTAPNTGLVSIQTLDNGHAGFRVAATGVITDIDCGQAKVVQPLKLVGEPMKIFQNTCFVKGMFGSPLEVARFEGASIRTVGNFHSVGRSEAGHVFTWGYGEEGQLGHDHAQEQWAPRQVEAGRFGGEKVVLVTAGGCHMVLVTAGGGGGCTPGGLDTMVGWGMATPTAGWCRRWWGRGRAGDRRW